MTGALTERGGSTETDDVEHASPCVEQAADLAWLVGGFVVAESVRKVVAAEEGELFGECCIVGVREVVWVSAMAARGKVGNRQRKGRDATSASRDRSDRDRPRSPGPRTP